MLSGHFCLIRGPCCVREHPLSAQLQDNSPQPCCAGRVAAMPEPPISVGLPVYPHPCRAAVRLCFRDLVWARRCFIITFRSSNMPLSGQTPLLLGRRLLPMPGCGNVRCRPPLRPEPAMCTTAGRNAHMPASRRRRCSRPLQVVPRPASELCHQVVHCPRASDPTGVQNLGPSHLMDTMQEAKMQSFRGIRSIRSLTQSMRWLL